MRATAASSSIGARCWLDLCHPVGIDNLRVQLGMSAFGAKRTLDRPKRQPAEISVLSLQTEQNGPDFHVASIPLPCLNWYPQACG